MTGERAPALPPRLNESGLVIEPLYTADELAASGGLAMLGRPGEYPFTRGIHPLMYRKQPWTMRQYTGFGNAADTNARFKYLIANGQTGLNVAFDLPTQCGLDSDDAQAEGEVGRVGMAVDTLRDFEIAFDGIDLDRITVSLTINGAAAILIAMYLALAAKRGYDVTRLRGTAQNDILKEYIGRGTWIFPVQPSIRLVGDTIEYCARHAPKYSPVSVCGYHIRESGATPTQEMAYAFCIARAYADEVIRRGLPVDEFAGRLSYNFNIFGSLFEQVAKFRAGRGLWAKIMKEQYGASQPGSMWLRMIAGGGGGGLTAEQPENNIVRGAYYALISALAGAQTMALCCYDEAYTIPSEHAQRLSLRTMQLLIEEMGLTDTADPLGGSYYIETLTTACATRWSASWPRSTPRAASCTWCPRASCRRACRHRPTGASATSSRACFARSASTAIAATTKRRTPSRSTPTAKTTRARKSAPWRACAPSATPRRWRPHSRACAPMRARAPT